MAWRMAKGLEVLREQINALSPNRSKASDGGKGDDAHASRGSDHNPNAQGVVTARDFTHDPAHGIDSEKLAEALLASRDKRIKYVISNRKIASGDNGPSPWAWRKYTGPNPHDHHVHVSVLPSNADDTRPWDLSGVHVTEDHHMVPVAPEKPTLRVGNSGAFVSELQELLNKHGAGISVDGKFGPGTQAAVKKFQSEKNLVADGIVGAYTWRALEQ